MKYIFPVLICLFVKWGCCLYQNLKAAQRSASLHVISMTLRQQFCRVNYRIRGVDIMLVGDHRPPSSPSPPPPSSLCCRVAITKLCGCKHRVLIVVCAPFSACGNKIIFFCSSCSLTVKGKYLFFILVWPPKVVTFFTSPLFPVGFYECLVPREIVHCARVKGCSTYSDQQRAITS